METPFNEDDDLNAIDVFEDGVAATRSLINRLRTTKLAMLGIDSIKASIDDLEERSHSHPEQDCSVTLSELKLEHKLLTDKTSASTIPREHLIHHEISRLRSRLQALNLRPPPSVEGTATSVTSKLKTVQLPKLNLPTFSGDLMDWATFRSQFKTAVDSNTELDQEHKLAYLRDAIKDPAVRSLLFSSAARDGLYAEVVATLHQRYDKRRIIHANYCARLIALTHAKNTKADLRQLADRINNAVSGLKHTKQYDLPSFLSSVMAALLPK